ncbi:MAG: hypothetical protein LBS18_06165 [Clostridiales bacterium]|jgi:hypothetical protein|nr:hypothetical protein [Clostridiales bacterium]
MSRLYKTISILLIILGAALCVLVSAMLFVYRNEVINPRRGAIMLLHQPINTILLYIVYAAMFLLTGIYGVKNHRNGKKAWFCIFMAALFMGLVAADIVLAKTASLFISLFIALPPLLYLIGAIQNGLLHRARDKAGQPKASG